MDYELFLFSECTPKELSEVLINIIKETINRETTVSYNDEILIACGLFSIAIELEDYDDIEFINSYYSTNVNTPLYVQVSTADFYNTISEVFKVLVKLLESCDNAVLLVVNGSEQVFRKDLDIVTFNANIDYIPYESIKIPYKKEKLNLA